MVGALGKGRILLWGRDKVCVSSLCEMLTQREYVVTGVMSRENLLRELSGQTPDLLLIDTDTHENEGIAILRDVRVIDSRVAIILIEGNGSAGTVREQAGDGIFAHVGRPFQPEELLRKVDQAMCMRLLPRSEELYRTVFEDAGEGFYLMMPHGQYFEVNKALARILGYESPDELLAALSGGRQDLYVDSGLRERAVGLARRGVINSGFELRARKKNGSMVWLSESVGCIRSKDGELICYGGTVRDITDRKKAESELRQSEQYYRHEFERDAKRKKMLLEIIDEIHGSYQDLDDVFMHVVAAISAALDERRQWQRGHSENVATYSWLIAKRMGLDEAQMRDLRLAALLHDIGHIAVPDEIICKPAKLTRAEFEPIKRHPCAGAAMLSGVKQLAHIIPIIRHHHERFDGSGYPDGLKGSEIPLGARILHLADSYDSMTAARPYRRTPGRAYALREVETCSNAQFDPDISKCARAVL